MLLTSGVVSTSGVLLLLTVHRVLWGDSDLYLNFKLQKSLKSFRLLLCTRIVRFAPLGGHE